MRVIVVIKMKTNPMVKTEVICPTTVQVRHIPLPKACRFIACVFHHLANCQVLDWIELRNTATKIVFICWAKSCWIPACKKSRSRRRTDWKSCVPVGAANPVTCKLIHVRGLGIWTSIATNITIPKIVCKNEQHVWFFTRN